MHQHAVFADGVQLQVSDLEIIDPDPLQANRQPGHSRGLAGLGQELVAEPQPAGLGPAACRGHG